jgi:hypothetical protein
MMRKKTHGAWLSRVLDIDDAHAARLAVPDVGVAFGDHDLVAVAAPSKLRMPDEFETTAGLGNDLAVVHAKSLVVVVESMVAAILQMGKPVGPAFRGPET